MEPGHDALPFHLSALPLLVRYLCMLSFLVDCSSSSCLGMPCWLMHNLPVVVGNSTHSLSLLLVLPLCTSLHFPSCMHRPPLIYAIAHSLAHPTRRHTPTHTSAHLPCLLSRSFIYPPLSTCLLTYLLIHNDKHHLTASTSHEHVCWSRHISRTLHAFSSLGFRFY